MVPNRGNAGAISIGYSKTYPHNDSTLIEVMNSSFSGNAARLENTSFSGVNSVLSQQIYVQRGGGLGCYFSAPGLKVYMKSIDTLYMCVCVCVCVCDASLESEHG